MRKSASIYRKRKNYNGSMPQAHQKIPLWFTEKAEIKPVTSYKIDPSKLDDFIKNNDGINLNTI
jgi:hypothetical protein